MKRFLWAGFAGLAALAGLIAAAQAQSSNQPSNQTTTRGWRLETVKSGLERPWSLNFLPDGRLLYTTRYTGELQALNVKTGELQRFATTLPNFRAEGEGGMMGMEVAPDFERSNRLFICYSYWKDGQRDGTARRNRLSSFILKGSKLEQERVLLDEMLGWSNHNGCRVILSPDTTKLFVSMGDAAAYPPGPQKAQEPATRAGKVFRINLDGSIPGDNPTAGSPVWTLGHRNIQGLAFHPVTGALWSTEHGPDVKDELNIIKKGRNYGWPLCQGTAAESRDCRLENYEAAVKSYDPDNTVAMSDMVFYTGSAFPAWQNNLFFVTLKTGRLYRLELNGERISREEMLIDGDYGRLRDITVGGDGFLYLSTDSGTNSSILRLRPR